MAFDFKPVLKEMLALYEERTRMIVEGAPMIEYLESSCRVSWSDTYDCMQRHGFKGSVVDARVDFEEHCGDTWRREAKKLRKKYAEI